MQLRSTPLAFGLKFLLVFVVLAAAFEATRGTTFERVAVEDLVLKPTAALIDRVTGGAPTRVDGRTLVSGATRLHVIRGCEGIELFLLLAAGILAYPAPWARRIRGMAVGFALAFALSVLRLTALDCTLRFAPGAWEALHGLVLPLAPVLILMLYFSRWTSPGDSNARSPDLQQESHAA